MHLKKICYSTLCMSRTILISKERIWIMKSTLKKLMVLGAASFAVSLNACALENAEWYTHVGVGAARLATSQFHKAEDHKKATIADFSAHALRTLAALQNLTNNCNSVSPHALISSEREAAYRLGWGIHDALRTWDLGKKLWNGETVSAPTLNSQLADHLHTYVLPAIEIFVATYSAAQIDNDRSSREIRLRLATLQSLLRVLEQVVESDLKTTEGRGRAFGLVAHVLLTLGEFVGTDGGRPNLIDHALIQLGGIFGCAAAHEDDYRKAPAEAPAAAASADEA